MDALNFEIVLNYGMDTMAIKPPSSFLSLLEIAKEAYDLTIVNRLVYYDEGEEIKISCDSEYLEFFDYVDANQLKEIDVIIKSDDKAKRKKSTSLRKRSSVVVTSGSRAGGVSDDNCINDNLDADYEADLRNKKHGMEEGKWSKQSYKQNEVRRVNYIKEKKEKQRQEQLERQQGAGNFGIPEEDESDHKNIRKRELKSSKNKMVADDMEPAEDQKKGKNFYKNKK